MDGTISVVVSTKGRPSLWQTLQSIVQQQQVGDEVIVVQDGRWVPRTDIHAATTVVGARHVVLDAGESWYGVAQTNLGFTLVHGDFVLHLGDDDVFTPGTFDRVRVCSHETVTLGRAAMRDGKVVWDRPRLMVTKISGMCAIVPRSLLCRYRLAHSRQVDHQWIKLLLQRARREPEWLDHVMVQEQMEDGDDAEG